MRDDERPGIEGLIARYREERAAEDPLHRRALRPDRRGGLRGAARRLRRQAHRRAHGASSTRGRRRPEWPSRAPSTGLDPDRPPAAQRPQGAGRAHRRGLLVRRPGGRPGQRHRAARHAHRLQAPALPARDLRRSRSTDDLEPFIDEVKSLQDLLGDIHDCDVQIPMLEDHLAWLNEREGGRRPAPGGRRPPRGPRRRSAPASRGRLPRVRSASSRSGRRGDERLGRPRPHRAPPPRARRALRAVPRRVAPPEGASASARACTRPSGIGDRA